MARKDPALLWYPADWVNGTMGMTLEEKGAYITLLMMQFSRGHMTTHMIGQEVGQLWVSIKDKFVQDENGLWYNERLDEEKQKRRNYVESRKNNMPGANQHTNTKRSYEQPYDLHDDLDMTSHMVNVNVNTNKDIKRVKESKTATRARVEKTPLEKALDEFAKMRKEIKAPLTDRARRMIINKLEELAPDDEATQIKIIEQSILHCWKSVFELKSNTQRATGSKSANPYLKMLEEEGVTI